jgi:membrane protease YdiL (CAAX protease family)
LFQIAEGIRGRTHRVRRHRSEAATALAAFTITSVTAWGCEIITTSCSSREVPRRRWWRSSSCGGENAPTGSAPCGGGRRVYLLIVLVPHAITGIRLVAFAIGDGTFESSPVFDGPATLVAFLVPLFLFGPLTEEFGWRGYAQDRALVAGGPVRASLLIGALWVGWHLPLFLIPGTIQQARGEPLGEFLVFAVYIAASSFVYTGIHLDAGRALWAAILLHFSLNLNDSVLAELMDAGISDRLVQAFVTAAIAALFVMRWRRADSAIIKRRSPSRFRPALTPTRP